MGRDSLHQGEVGVDAHDAVDIQLGGITVRFWPYDLSSGLGDRSVNLVY